VRTRGLPTEGTPSFPTDPRGPQVWRTARRNLAIGRGGDSLTPRRRGLPVEGTPSFPIDPRGPQVWRTARLNLAIGRGGIH
jgi:hypothetical protein